MKGSGWVGVLAIGVGALMIWAGFTGNSLSDAFRSVLTGSPLPRRAATPGTAGASGFSPQTGGEDDPGAGTGVGGNGGGGW